jgi:hypothetical protein
VTTFHIDEKALLLPSDLVSERHIFAGYFGTEVTVKSALRRTGMDCEGGRYYEVETFDGNRLAVVPWLLQKLPPPPPNWNAIAARDDLVRDEKRPAQLPAITSLLQLVGQEIAT